MTSSTKIGVVFTILTRQADFGVVHAVGHQHQDADALGVRLFPGQVARRLLVLDRAAEGRDPAARLEVERRARAHQVVGGRAVAQAQLLALLQHTERRRRVAHLKRDRKPEFKSQRCRSETVVKLSVSKVCVYSVLEHRAISVASRVEKFTVENHPTLIRQKPKSPKPKTENV